MIKRLEVPLLPDLHCQSAMQKISAILDDLERNRIAYAPWPEFNYVPEVYFSIGHGGDCIFLKYYVTETTIKAVWEKPNDPVYKDSCVEFFISFGQEKTYYNIEFNAIGTCKFNYGLERNNRKLIHEKYISTIRYFVTIQNLKANDLSNVHWELTLMIPVDAFSENKISTLAGITARTNFYKCGDDLPVPHFLAWNNIQAPQPDFHVPECFGEMIFK